MAVERNFSAMKTGPGNSLAKPRRAVPCEIKLASSILDKCRQGLRRNFASIALLDVVSDHSVIRFCLLDVSGARIARLPAVRTIPGTLRILNAFSSPHSVPYDGDLAEDAFKSDLVEHRYRVSEHAHTRDVGGCFSDQVLLHTVFHLPELVLVHLTLDWTERMILHDSKEVSNGVALV